MPFTGIGVQYAFKEYCNRAFLKNTLTNSQREALGEEKV